MLERQHVQRQPRERRRAEVRVDPHPLACGQLRLDPVEEPLPVDAMLGREPFGDGVRQLVHGPLVVVRLAPRLEDRRTVPLDAAPVVQHGPDLVRRPQVRMPRPPLAGDAVSGRAGQSEMVMPVIIGYDGSEPAERAIRESATLLAAHPALVVTVWEPGRAFEAATLPIMGFDMPPTAVDFRAATEAEDRLREAMQQTAQRGAQLARESGYTSAQGLAVADDITVADTLLRVAEEQNAQGLVVGRHGHRRLTEALLGSTSSRLVHKSTLPILVVGPPPT
ncbi:universal stress protein [Dactylosporangium sp. AC04546]|uniref:universal stress protein n=1 Tax=Dactylosporangium sp. AC04546 TaxID=2862460 RepID=UPI001EDEDDA2|nr:universal stress protein [Dactylosporangium sp. AC04546]WVK87772.1 universal stress protein [Dactylosporangium sp. AC04546]